MALDMAKMRAKKSALDNGGKASKFWKPEDGKQVVRIVPTEDGDPFREFWFHYRVENSGLLCPNRNFGDNCSVCSFVSGLFNDGTEESVSMAKDLCAKQRFFSPVLPRDSEDEGVKIWGYSKTVYGELLDLVLNEEYGDVTDPKTGTDLTITVSKPAGQRFPSTKVDPKRKSSPLHSNEEQAAEWLSTVPEISFERKSSQEVQESLDRYLSLEDGDTSTTADTPETTRGKVSQTQTGDNRAAAVDQAFSELMNA